LVNARLEEKKDLTEEERNILSISYKHAVGFRRSSFRALEHEEEKQNPFIINYKKILKSEAIRFCQEILNILMNKLVPNAKSPLANTSSESALRLQESCIFYLKMIGDYYRYLAEFDDTDDVSKKAEKYYDEGYKMAVKHLSTTHPIRLGLSLNLSVCYYEILKDREKACEVAKSAFDSAIAELDSLDERCYKDSTVIMQLLRDNLSLWTTNTN